MFPIEWRKSKMDGFAVRLTMAEARGFSLFTTLEHTRARIFGPEVGGIIFNQSDLTSVTVQRVDHNQALQSTTHLQYQLPKRLPWFALTCRYDSGIVSNAVPDLASLLALTPDQQQMIGFYCKNQVATLANPITTLTCPVDSTNYGSKLVNIPAPGTENDDKNPARVKPRHLFDLAIGSNNAPRPRQGCESDKGRCSIMVMGKPRQRPGSGPALATVVGVLVEVPVMLSVCGVCNRTRHWFPTEVGLET